MNSESEWYQGEVDENGVADGLGIYILPGELITIGHRIKDKLHGQMVTIYDDGMRKVGAFQHGKCEGK
jgi:hypothetical protein